MIEPKENIIKLMKRWLDFEPHNRLSICPFEINEDGVIYTCTECHLLFPRMDKRFGHACPCSQHGLEYVTRRAKRWIKKAKK